MNNKINIKPVAELIFTFNDGSSQSFKNKEELIEFLSKYKNTKSKELDNLNKYYEKQKIYLNNAINETTLELDYVMNFKE